MVEIAILDLHRASGQRPCLPRAASARGPNRSGRPATRGALRACSTPVPPGLSAPFRPEPRAAFYGPGLPDAPKRNLRSGSGASGDSSVPHPGIHGKAPSCLTSAPRALPAACAPPLPRRLAETLLKQHPPPPPIDGGPGSWYPFRARAHTIAGCSCLS